MFDLQEGEVLVTDITDPDWCAASQPEVSCVHLTRSRFTVREPVMRRASAIVTNRGGRTCHAAIVAREVGIPAVVGCGRATQMLMTDTPVTVCCAEGDTGSIYDGLLAFTRTEVDTATMERPKRTKLTLIMSNPELAFGLSSSAARFERHSLCLPHSADLRLASQCLCRVWALPASSSSFRDSAFTHRRASRFPP